MRPHGIRADIGGFIIRTDIPYAMSAEELRAEMGDDEYFETLEAREVERELMDR